MNKVTIPNEVLLAEISGMLKEGHTVVFLAKGSSMLPFIVGDRDSVELIANKSPEVGDIALGEITPGHWVLHRIVKKVQGGYVLKGDGNLDGTEYCATEALAGTVINIIRPDGKKISCLTGRFKGRSARWRGLPRLTRRILLAIYRRII